MSHWDRPGISALVGLTITEVRGAESGSDEVFIHTKEGRTFKMYHSQDCCESVTFDEVQGELDDILNFPVTLAEESTSDTDNKNAESSTWTFYRIGTERGVVVLRWAGYSNGYYSETANFMELN